MCDTLVLRQGGVTYFAKNSDREPGEPQLVVRLPPVADDARTTVRATYVEIPQAARRFGVLLSKPCWTWGAEMGVNDQGVAIGNEAVFTRVQERAPGLLGMDLVRLGLERGATARHALDVITRHLETYGQGGGCGYRDRSFRYDNSFLLADAAEAWILETAGRHWVARRVEQDAALSNALTLGAAYDLHAEGLADFARRGGRYDGHGPLDFARTFTAPLLTRLSAARARRAAGLRCLARLDEPSARAVAVLMRHLRSHVHPAPGLSARRNADVCMHAAGYLRRSQTCGSMVARLSVQPAVFFTGTSAPCLSVFKPATFDAAIRFGVLHPDGQPVEGALWHRHEQIHRRVLLDGRDRDALLASRDQAERRLLVLLDRDDPTPADYRAADEIVMRWQDHWHDRFAGRPLRYPLRLHSLFWRRWNRLDGIGA